jgi:hypothetical protein
VLLLLLLLLWDVCDGSTGSSGRVGCLCCCDTRVVPTTTSYALGLPLLLLLLL